MTVENSACSLRPAERWQWLYRMRLRVSSYNSLLVFEPPTATLAIRAIAGDITGLGSLRVVLDKDILVRHCVAIKAPPGNFYCVPSNAK